MLKKKEKRDARFDRINAKRIERNDTKTQSTKCDGIAVSIEKLLSENGVFIFAILKNSLEHHSQKNSKFHQLR